MAAQRHAHRRCHRGGVHDCRRGLGDAGAYSVVVSNAAGSVTSSAGTLSMLPLDDDPTAPAVQTPPTTLVACLAARHPLAVAASGSAPLTYAWARNGTTLPAATGPVLAGRRERCRCRQLHGDGAQRGCRQRDERGSAADRGGCAGHHRGAVRAGRDEGGVASFSVTASGDGLRYQWTRDNVAISGATASGYTTPVLTLADNGARYGVIVYSGAGVAISSGTAHRHCRDHADADAASQRDRCRCDAQRHQLRPSVSADGRGWPSSRTATT